MLAPETGSQPCAPAPGVMTATLDGRAGAIRPSDAQGPSAFSPGALPCSLSRPQVAGRHPSASQAWAHRGWGEAGS